MGQSIEGTNINCTPKVVADANIMTLTLVTASKLLRGKGTSLFQYLQQAFPNTKW